jgi:hypothetical protein
MKQSPEKPGLFSFSKRLAPDIIPGGVVDGDAVIVPT